MKSKSYCPSSGTEGYAFFEAWCENCARDKPMSEGKDMDECDDSEICQIIGDSMAYPVGHPRFPKAWVYDENGHPCCTEFVKAGTELTNRCERTVDMFEVAA